MLYYPIDDFAERRSERKMLIHMYTWIGRTVLYATSGEAFFDYDYDYLSYDTFISDEGC